MSLGYLVQGVAQSGLGNILMKKKELEFMEEDMAMRREEAADRREQFRLQKEERNRALQKDMIYGEAYSRGGWDEVGKIAGQTGDLSMLVNIEAHQANMGMQEANIMGAWETAGRGKLGNVNESRRQFGVTLTSGLDMTNPQAMYDRVRRMALTNPRMFKAATGLSKEREIRDIQQIVDPQTGEVSWIPIVYNKNGKSVGPLTKNGDPNGAPITINPNSFIRTAAGWAGMTGGGSGGGGDASRSGGKVWKPAKIGDNTYGLLNEETGEVKDLPASRHQQLARALEYVDDAANSGAPSNMFDPDKAMRVKAMGGQIVRHSISAGLNGQQAMQVFDIFQEMALYGHPLYEEFANAYKSGKKERINMARLNIFAEIGIPIQGEGSARGTKKKSKKRTMPKRQGTYQGGLSGIETSPNIP